MARTVALTTLIARVRRRADIETDLHITDGEIADSINESVAALHSIIVEAGEDDFLTWATFNTVAGQEEYDLTDAYLEMLPEDVPPEPWEPGDAPDFLIHFYKLEWAEVRVSGRWIPLERWQFEQRHLYEDPSRTWSSHLAERAYRLGKRDTIRLLPAPDGEHTVRLWVHLASADVDLEQGQNTYDGRDGWEEWVVLDAAIKCAMKEEADVSVMMTEREKVERRIIPQARTKDRGRVKRVRDVEASRRRSGWDY